MRTILLFNNAKAGLCLIKDHYKKIIPSSQTEIESYNSFGYWKFRSSHLDNKLGLFIHADHILQTDKQYFSHNGHLAIIETSPIPIALYVNDFVTERSITYIWNNLIGQQTTQKIKNLDRSILNVAVRYNMHNFLICDPILIKKKYFLNSQSMLDSIQ